MEGFPEAPHSLLPPLGGVIYPWTSVTICIPVPPGCPARYAVGTHTASADNVPGPSQQSYEQIRTSSLSTDEKTDTKSITVIPSHTAGKWRLWGSSPAYPPDHLCLPSTLNSRYPSECVLSWPSPLPGPPPPPSFPTPIGNCSGAVFREKSGGAWDLGVSGTQSPNRIPPSSPIQRGLDQR